MARKGRKEQGKGQPKARSKAQSKGQSKARSPGPAKGPASAPARSAPSPPRRSAPRIALLALGLVAAAAVVVAVLVLRGDALPPWEPPLPDAMERIDPEVAKLVRAARAAIETAPGDTRAIARLGRIFDANDLPREARECYLRAVRVDPEQARAWYYLGRGLLVDGESERAIEALEEVTRLAPEYGPAWRHLGLALLDANDLGGARAALERAARLESGYAATVGLARVLARENRHAEVVELLQPVVRGAPDDGRAHYQLGLSLRAVGRMDDAAVHLSVGERRGKLLEQDPWLEGRREVRLSAQAMIDDADNLYAAGHVDLAAEHLEKLVARQPEHVEALNNLAVAYMELGRLREADDLLARAQGLRPQHFPTAINRASYHVRLAERDRGSADVELGRALAYADRATRYGPQSSRAWLIRARILGLMGRWPEAAVSAEEALALDAREADPADVLGECRAQQGDLDGAATSFEVAVARDPASGRLRANLALVYLRLGRRDEADRAAREALALEPANPTAKGVLAQLAQGGGGG